MHGLKIGVHLPLAGGLDKVAAAAKRLRLESVQIFSGNPRSFTPKPLDPEVAARFRTGLAARLPVVVHAPYLLNLASPDEAGWSRSRGMLLTEMDRCAALGVADLVFHPGSHLGSGVEAGVARVVEALKQGLDQGPAGVRLVVENTAGAGGGLGGPLEELAAILAGVGGGQRVGVCLDTAHAFGAGYDLSRPQGVDEWLDRVARLIGMDQVALIHLNDSSRGLGTHLDRHADIGKGLIGSQGLQRVITHPALDQKPGVMETPKSSEADDKRNLAMARRLRTIGLKEMNIK